MTTNFKPIIKEHYFARTFGDWLFDITGVVPTKEETAKRDLRDFSENELNDHMKKHKVLKELPINKEFESLENVTIAVLRHLKETGVLQGIRLPFEQIKSGLKGVEKAHITDINLNYGEDGQGGQRNPKPQHILQMLRRWRSNGLTVGLARKNPATGEYFVNEGQQRSIAGGIIGRVEFSYEYEESEDPLIDLIQFKTENQGKLHASEAEILLSDAISIKRRLEEYCDKKKTDILDVSYGEICKELSIDKRDEEFRNFQIWNELSNRQSYKIVNADNLEEKNNRGSCSNVSQLKEVFDCKDYSLELIQDALRLYHQAWGQRRLETGDLIGLLETLYFNKDWLYNLDKDDFQFAMIKISNAIEEQWPNKTRSKTAWSNIQDAKTDQFPFKTKEEKEKHYHLYSASGTRVAQHMWLAQGFYSVLSQRMKKADAEKLVRPTSVEESIEYDLVMPVVN
tara:strand:- start:532 stop:1893 length:1362 start_codon:yes stop_codon:yes gene_type:complete